MSKKKNNKEKKKKHYIGLKEFLFDFISLVALIGLGIYFGGRSLYYYSKQNNIKEKEAMTLNGLVLSNNKTTKDNEDGLHLDSDGYYFKGNINNNYVLFGNKLFRIIRINNDNTVKMVTENYVSSFMWGEESSYQNSNVRNWLEKTGEDYSGIYYDVLPDANKYLVKTDYTEDVMKNNKVVSSKKTFKDYVTLLTINDYILSSGKSGYLNNGKMFFLLGLNDESSNLYVEADGSIQSCDSLEGFGIRPVITLKKNTVVLSGSGTIEDPYVIDVGQDDKYIDKYVSLGGELWRIYDNKSGILRLYKNGYISMNGSEVMLPYTSSVNNITSIYNPLEKGNIGYILNNNYLNGLSYKDLLLDTDFYIGEISDDVGYNYKNIYLNKVTCKIGLLNIFDYNSNNYFDDYFHVNTTSEVGSMQYNVNASGLLTESDVREVKHIAPVISISSDVIKGGSGLENDPYVVG